MDGSRWAIIGPLMAFEIRITGRMIRRAALALAAAGLTVLLVVGGLYLFGADDPLSEFVDEGTYQAVFLSDGRVFFGRLTRAGSYYELRDAYYVEQAPGGEEGEPPTQEVFPRIGDIHGPQGHMLIPTDQVIVIENLRHDSELATTIDGLQNQSSP